MLRDTVAGFVHPLPEQLAELQPLLGITWGIGEILKLMRVGSGAIKLRFGTRGKKHITLRCGQLFGIPQCLQTLVRR